MTMTGNATLPVSWRDRVAIVAGVSGVAVAAWLIPASVHIVRWSGDGPLRLALFGSRYLLVSLAIVAMVVSVTLLALAWRSPTRLATYADLLRPLALLWFWAVPYLPWLPDRVPLLLVLAGPIRWVIAIVAVASALRIPSRVAALLQSARVPSRRALFLVSLALYVAFGFVATRVTGPGGDEPHYLMISQSLLADGDLLIENNHQLKQYRAFYGGELRPDYMTRAKNGEIYSIHAPGLPILLLPGYAIAGYPGALVTMCVIAALTALAIFELASAMVGPRTAVVAWMATCVTIPYLPDAWLIYPEMAGALIVAWAALWIWKPEPHRIAVWLWRGVVLATLPWLHTKFVVFLAIFGLALAFQARRRIRALMALAAPVAVSGVAWLSFFYVLYGSFSPEAPYGDYATLYVLAKNIPRGLLGLMFDQKFGLLFYSPIYLVAVVGCWAMLRRIDTRYLGGVLFVVVAAFMASTTRLYMWWGGSSPPARFVVPLLPCLAPMVALGVAEFRTVAAKTLVAVWLAVSVGVAIAAALAPEQRFFFSDPHGYARLLEALQAGSPLAATFPTFTTEDWRTPLLQLMPWLLAAASAIGALVAGSRYIRRASPLWSGALAAIVFLLVAGAGTARPETAVREETVRRGALDVIWQWDPARHAFEYGRNAKVDESRLRELGVVTFSGAQPASVALPAGAYEARIWFAGAAARQGEVTVASQKAVFARYAGPLHNPTSVPFELPVSLDRVTVNVRDDAVAKQVVSTEIVPRALTPVSARDSRRVRAIEQVDGSAGYLVYVDQASFPEGGVFWTRGTEAATVLIATAGASRLVLTLHLGPAGGSVRVNVAGQESMVGVHANETERFEAAIPSAMRLVPVTIQAPAQFRPSDVDPKSDDTRRLGCQVRVSLE
jgi:hypothetical protein